MATPSELYIVRHGIAEDEHPDHPGLDHYRRLTEEGRVRTLAAARHALECGILPGEIWASPHLRAQETAQIFRDVLKPDALVEVRELGIGHRLQELLDRIEFAGVKRLMIVGHNPQVSELVADLCTDGRLQIAFGKATLAHVRLVRRPRGLVGELAALIPARG